MEKTTSGSTMEFNSVYASLRQYDHFEETMDCYMEAPPLVEEQQSTPVPSTLETPASKNKGKKKETKKMPKESLDGSLFYEPSKHDSSDNEISDKPLIRKRQIIVEISSDHEVSDSDDNGAASVGSNLAVSKQQRNTVKTSYGSTTMLKKSIESNDSESEANIVAIYSGPHFKPDQYIARSCLDFRKSFFKPELYVTPYTRSRYIIPNMLEFFEEALGDKSYYETSQKTQEPSKIVETVEEQEKKSTSLRRLQSKPVPENTSPQNKPQRHAQVTMPDIKEQEKETQQHSTAPSDEDKQQQALTPAAKETKHKQSREKKEKRLMELTKKRQAEKQSTESAKPKQKAKTPISMKRPLSPSKDIATKKAKLTKPKKEAASKEATSKEATSKEATSKEATSKEDLSRKRLLDSKVLLPSDDLVCSICSLHELPQRVIVSLHLKDGHMENLENTQHLRKPGYTGGGVSWDPRVFIKCVNCGDIVHCGCPFPPIKDYPSKHESYVCVECDTVDEKPKIEPVSAKRAKKAINYKE